MFLPLSRDFSLADANEIAENAFQRRPMLQRRPTSTGRALREGARGYRVEAADRTYHSGRSRELLKTKCVLSDIFVIIGFRSGSGAVRTPLANIKVARFDGHRPRYAGAVGTGFSERVASALRERLDRLRRERCAVAGLKVGGAVWVSPDLSRDRLPPRNDARRASTRELSSASPFRTGSHPLASLARLPATARPRGRRGRSWQAVRGAFCP